ncbi:hypothetical protein A3H90_02445 [Candidatus Peribacteria bacterium RIFCSPLOWO2_02_FULL_55_36]|nr:MAG: hypothetical protein A2789_00180 [Candidatus Peribacteria bacterium RIFCSPHIGHO2_01_FULL_54_22]OGJ62817.1 MAG: hypothetical protein A3D12_03355 [Candidatus Peribacteria bacterium RIFCSPHIGHO2_02_FULL_55_24]OGJ63618.1 MAG: hypothetical protein A3E47_00260 [Candidatus Peribacteria bacterium RIFCSPHIGHO2_12_FULL_54_10]OGJ69497.1 MAG: hypothetical protein A3H90_02445 [Candidatus Peribacteria bacterium RIFCSPLOWO2_02_FULL_55_36]
MSNKPVVFLEGDIIYLRPLEESDIEGTYNNWLNDKEACDGNAHHTYPQTREDTLKYIRYALTTKTELILAICDKKTNTHIGNIALQNITPIHGNAELAIFIGDKDFWGKGYGKEACRLLIEHGFAALNLHRIWVGTAHTNIGMQKIAESLGMKYEGRHRDAVYKNGGYRDALVYSRLSTDE